MPSIRPPKRTDYDLVVLGGGAAGLMAAASVGQAARAEGRACSILVVDRMPEPGRKLRATGNGRGNIGHRDAQTTAYVTLGDPEAAARYVAAQPLSDALALLDRWGLSAAVEDGRLYPRSFRAADVCDTLTAVCRDADVEFCTRYDLKALRTPDAPQKTLRLQPTDDAGPTLTLRARTVLCALGGASQPGLGADGRWQTLPFFRGLNPRPFRPALQALRVPDAPPSWHGVRREGVVCLWTRTEAHAWTPVAAERGEIQFTRDGISGVVVMQLSMFLAGGQPTRSVARPDAPIPPEIPDPSVGYAATLDLFPDLSVAELTALLERRQREAPWQDGDAWARGLLPEGLGAVLHAEATRTDPSGADPARYARLAKALSCPLDPTAVSPQAQVSLGGLPVEALTESGRIRAADGIYAAGEMVDVSGFCGGFNLQLAFAAGLAAAREISVRDRELKGTVRPKHPDLDYNRGHRTEG